MSVYENADYKAHEHVSFFADEKVGLKTIIAIHSTKLGPAGGGIRFFPYQNTDAALTDVLRLSRAMSYKFALAGLPLGGGKSVIIGDPATLKTEALLEAFGRCVHRLGGKYYCAEDIGMTPQDMVVIHRATPYAVGLPGKSGDTSPPTGYGIYKSIKAAADFKLSGNYTSVAILGFGNVGRNLARYLAEEGVQIYVADINQENVKLAVSTYGAKEVGVDDIFALEVDVLAPCALGGVLDDTSIPKIKAKIVCGGANNQLLDEKRHSKMLDDRGILFVPDYVANAGGAISGSAEYGDRPAEETQKLLDNIYTNCMNIFELSEKKKITTLEAAEELAQKVLA